MRASATAYAWPRTPRVGSLTRRAAGRAQRRAGGGRVGDLAVDLYPTLGLRGRAWELCDDMTAADALSVALAESSAWPLVTKDAGLAAAATEHSRAAVVVLAAP